MICKNCMKNVASVKFTEVVDGNAVQHYLCPECYQAQQEKAAGFSLAVPKPALRRSGRDRDEAPSRKTTMARCSGCNTDLAHVLESATVGCPACFTSFGQEIESLLEALHRGAAHRGKTFKCDDERLQISKEIQARRILLRRMLKEENYEEAARLRDEIADMESAAQRAANTG